MIFEYDVPVPANTLANSPVVVQMRLARGIIHKIEIDYPAGCNNMVLVTLRRGLHQVSPTNPDGQHKSNFHTVSFPTWYELLEAPYKVECYAWSPGTSYNHAITVRIGVLSKEVLAPEDRTTPLLQRLTKWLGIGSS